MARWDKEIALIKQITFKDDDGFDATDEQKRGGIFANKKSVKRSEFYMANQAGIRADVIFEMWAADYDGEKIVEWDGKRFKVIRTYEPGEDKIELTCSDISEMG